MIRHHLTPGVELVTVPGRGLAVRTPEGEFLRVETGGVPPESLIDGLLGAEGARTNSPQDGELARLVGAFVDAGYAVRADGEGRTGDRAALRHGAPLAGRTVLVLGADEITRPLARGAEAAGAEVREVSAERVAELANGAEAERSAGAARSAKAERSADAAQTGDVARTADAARTAVVWCLDAPVPPGLWDAADGLPGRGVGWLRCHREGRQAWLEPFAAAPGDVTSAHVRLRRLAATAAHRELAAYWEGSRTPERVRPSGPGSAGLIAGLLLGDLVAWAAGSDPGGGRLPARRRLRRVDVRDMTITEHPVLPVPRVAPLGGPRTGEAR
ncbi:hypothetical protein [Streptomyces sp. NPDC003077]|uniref:hypothetical protein n=1 Tax=Streptomyces sp. NPDC003077 TaxID=3154443 RepID=UPI0033AB295F